VDDFFGKENVFRITNRDIGQRSDYFVDYLAEYISLIREVHDMVKEKRHELPLHQIFGLNDRLKSIYENANRNYIETGNLQRAMSVLDEIRQKTDYVQGTQKDYGQLDKDLLQLISYLSKSIGDINAGPYSLRRSFNLWKQYSFKKT
jgi:hypothetical protein